jgi:hypothetical protein
MGKLSVKDKIQQKRVLSRKKRENAIRHLANAYNHIQHTVSNLHMLVRRHIILLAIIQKRLGITDDEIQEEAQRVNDAAKASAKAGSVQPEEAGTDEDRDGSGRPELLDAEGSGEPSDDPDPASEGAQEDVSIDHPIDTVAGTSGSEDE